MTALDADLKVPRYDGVITAHQVKGGEIIYLGSLVNLDSAGLALPAADDATHTFAGVAVERADNREGADGDLLIQVRRENIHRYAISPAIALTDVGAAVYIVDDNNVTLTVNNVKCGVVAKFQEIGIADVDVAAAFASSTAGPQGATGPTGATGPAGPAGPAGTSTFIFNADCDPGDAIGDPVYIRADPVASVIQVTAVDIASSTFKEATAIGIIETKPTSTTCTVQVSGLLNVFSGLTFGDYVFSASGGGITHTVPTPSPSIIVQPLGQAVSSTEILVDIGTPIKRIT